MAGHSKWKNIQARKGAQDSKRGKIFTKIALEITVASRISGGNPDDNPRLRAALAKAKAANMPKDNQTKAIKKGTGELEGVNYVEKTYEGYGPGGVAIMVECLTDNINRTVGDVRYAFTRGGGNLGTDGSVSRMFDLKGVIIYETAKISDYEKFFEAAIEAGAEDVKEEEGRYEVISEPSVFNQLKAALDAFSEDPSFCEVTCIPNTLTPVDPDRVPALEKLINSLEDNDDVQNVFHNGDM